MSSSTSSEEGQAHTTTLTASAPSAPLESVELEGVQRGVELTGGDSDKTPTLSDAGDPKKFYAQLGNLQVPGDSPLEKALNALVMAIIKLFTLYMQFRDFKEDLRKETLEKHKDAIKDFTTTCEQTGDKKAKAKKALAAFDKDDYQEALTQYVGAVEEESTAGSKLMQKIIAAQNNVIGAYAGKEEQEQHTQKFERKLYLLEKCANYAIELNKTVSLLDAGQVVLDRRLQLNRAQQEKLQEELQGKLKSPQLDVKTLSDQDLSKLSSDHSEARVLLDLRKQSGSLSGQKAQIGAFLEENRGHIKDVQKLVGTNHEEGQAFRLGSTLRSIEKGMRKFSQNFESHISTGVQDSTMKSLTPQFQAQKKKLDLAQQEVEKQRQALQNQLSEEETQRNVNRPGRPSPS